MVMSSTVDGSINDATAGANAKLLAEAPAIALGNLYQTTAHAMGNAVENAVNAQQQMNIIAQAATTQGVMQIYSIDSATTGVAPEGTKTFSVPQALAVAAGADAVADAIQQAIESASRLELDEAGSWTHAARELMDMVADALWDFQKVTLDTGMALVKQAATTAVLVRMIHAPDQVEQYQKILAVIKEL